MSEYNWRYSRCYDLQPRCFWLACLCRSSGPRPCYCWFLVCVFTQPVSLDYYQRVLNDFWRARLSRGRTPFSSLPSASCLSFSVFLWVACRAGGRGWAWIRIICPQVSLALYKSINTLLLLSDIYLFPANLLDEERMYGGQMKKTRTIVYRIRSQTIVLSPIGSIKGKTAVDLFSWPTIA